MLAEKLVQSYLIASGSEADLDAVLTIDRLCFPAPWPEPAAAFTDVMSTGAGRWF